MIDDAGRPPRLVHKITWVEVEQLNQVAMLGVAHEDSPTAGTRWTWGGALWPNRKVVGYLGGTNDMHI